ncbi:MAG: glycosyltransferase [Bryobacteraceae bacterium]
MTSLLSQIGIVVITHNSAIEIGECLSAAAGTGAPVMVVDNGSADGTLDQIGDYPVTIVRNDVNLGFAGAVNQAVRKLDKDLILLLNPDCILQSPVDSLAEACWRPGVGVAGGKLIGPDGIAQRGFVVRRFPTPLSLAFEALLVNRVWPSNPVNRRFRCLDLNLDQAQEVDQPAGAFLMFRREAWCAVGGFDESFYPVWFEDVDFCKRVYNAGWSVYYEPRAVARHAGGHSVNRMRVEDRQISWYGSLLRYAGKHFRPGAGRAVCFAILVGAAVRALPAIFLERSLRPLKGCIGVMQLAGRRLCSASWRP